VTIEITQPDTEALIADYLRSGEFNSADELLNVALSALRDSRSRKLLSKLTNEDKRRLEGRKSLVELFEESPFKGLNMEFDESDEAKDFGQDSPFE
jgi:Arc/MetJ-type ribon-helix-helix transcriptional regulator